MISAMVVSSTSPPALIMSSRVRRVMAFTPGIRESRPTTGRGAEHRQPGDGRVTPASRLKSSISSRSCRSRSRCPTRETRGISLNCRGSKALISAVGDLPHAGGTGGVGNAGGAAAIVHHGIETIAFLFEARQQRPVERASARQLDVHRIDEAAVDQDLVVNVGAGRHAGRSDEADHLALPHLLAGLHALGEGRHVAVSGLIAVGVLQADVIAVAAFALGLLADTVSGA